MKPDVARLSAPSERVRNLREYYALNSPMVTDRELVPWKCSHSLYLYTEGWLAHADAPTVKLRRAEAERHMLERSKPVVRPGGSPISPPSRTKKKRNTPGMTRTTTAGFRRNAAEPIIWRWIIQSC